MTYESWEPGSPTHFTYMLINTINGKLYIGYTADPIARMAKHHQAAIEGKQTYLARAIRKHGWKNFLSYVIGIHWNLADAKKAEKLLIKLHNTTDRNVGYNLTGGGDGESNYAPKKKNIINQGWEDEWFDWINEMENA